MLNLATALPVKSPANPKALESFTMWYSNSQHSEYLALAMNLQTNEGGGGTYT